MPFQEVPLTASFRVIGHAFTGAVEIVNTFYVEKVTGTWDSSALTDIAEAIGNQWRDELVPLLATTYIFDRVDARDESEEFGNEITAEYNATGGGSAVPLSASACMLCNMTGEAGAAPRRGRLFISPFGEGDIAGDLWDATLAGNVQVAIQDMPGVIATANPSCRMVLVSRYSKSAVPTPPHKRTVAVVNQIASFEVPQKLAIQRDRRTGEGS